MIRSDGFNCSARSHQDGKGIRKTEGREEGDRGMDG